MSPNSIKIWRRTLCWSLYFGTCPYFSSCWAVVGFHAAESAAVHADWICLTATDLPPSDNGSGGHAPDHTIWHCSINDVTGGRTADPPSADDTFCDGPRGGTADHSARHGSEPLGTRRWTADDPGIGIDVRRGADHLLIRSIEQCSGIALTAYCSHLSSSAEVVQ